ncbi:nucleoside/nucleotide kinase family protein [Kitasatospora sp. NA04385]|uniref:nucleoside/nucleotide kinase family protein n=1 Tax=Kitasatospora sp. NA04385 TaxID=2742135 RepID=UPI00159126C5|nr:nucleoside/nucleotide kinase family protein [Kitasatospora sp. NA04385]QKW19616.1 nucleoside/nucleotide kinase family protein [Kitasatospora sp. NA04385]
MHVEGSSAPTSTPATEQPAAVAEQVVVRALGLLHGPGSGTGRTILGLAGAPAAGKSTLARLLTEEINRREGPDTAAHLPLDGFHLSNAQLDRLGLRPRKGAPETFDAHGYLALLRRVAADRFHDLYAPDFDRTLDEPVAARHLIRPHTRLVITEGNYLAAPTAPWTDARALLRELWYVEADESTRATRLLARHTAGGQDPEAARRRIDDNDRPNAAYVTTTRAACDWTVRTGEFAPGADPA